MPPRTVQLGRFLAVVAAGLLWTACSAQVVPISVNILTTSCQPVGPLDKVTHLRFILTAPDLGSPLDTVSVIGTRTTAVTNVPPGKNRVLEVRGYVGDPRDTAQPGRVVSLGRTLPFDIPSVVPASPLPALQLLLRRVNAYVPVSAGGTCAPMLSPRAGHTATLLKDGRVLLAGGLSSVAGGGTALSSTEILDPIQGNFTPGPNLEKPRAFHTASALGGGRVVIAGGEAPPVGGVGPVQVFGDGLVVDTASNNVQPFNLAQPRSRHGAASAQDGGVLFVGGVDPDGGVVGALEWFDPGTNHVQSLVDTLPRVGMVVTRGPDPNSVLVVGGSNGSQLIPDVDLFQYGLGTFGRAPQTAQLVQGRRAPGVAAFIDSAHFVVSGGYPDIAQTPASAPLGTSEVIGLSGANLTVSRGPAVVPRGDICSVALPAGQVLNVAGSLGGNLGAQSDGSTEILTVTPGSSTTALGGPPLAPPRYLHTCTELADGSALVTGGLDTTQNPPAVLQDAYVFTAAPAN